MGATREPPAYRCVVKFRKRFTPSHVFDKHELVMGDWGEPLPSARRISMWQGSPAPWARYNGKTQYRLTQWALFAHIPTSALVLVPGDRNDYFVVQPLDMNVARDLDRCCLSRRIKLLTPRLPRRSAPEEVARHLGRGNTCYLLAEGAAAALRDIVLSHGELSHREAGERRSKRKLAAARKYGPGGEGSDHRKLKEWVSQHPEAVGVEGPPGKMEEQFASGDRADIVFEDGRGGWAVVEIETHASGTWQGAFQAIKYRTLLRAEKGLPLDDERVRGILAAWVIPREVRELCAKYAITCCECRAGGRTAARASSA